MYNRWNAMLMAMADDEVIIYSSWDTTQKLLKNVADFMPRLCTLCHHVTRILYCPIILCMPPTSPAQPQGNLPMVIDWIPTTGLVPFQVQPGPGHEPLSPLLGRSHRNSTKLVVLKKLPQSRK